MSGTIVAQVVSFGAYPLLTHLYSPIEFGLFGWYTAILVVVVVVVNGGYESAIMLPTKEDEAHHVFAICGFLIFLSSILSLFIVLFFHAIIGDYIGNEKFVFWLYFLPLSIFLDGTYVAMSFLLNRRKDYKILTRSKIVQAFTSSIVGVVMGYYFKNIFGGLIIGFICGQLAAFVAIVFVVLKSFSLRELQFSEMKIQAKVYKDFPRYAVGSSYLNALSRQLPFFLLSYFYVDKSVLGYFTLAHKILSAPLTFIGTTVSQIFYEKAARAKAQGGGLLRIQTMKLVEIIGGLSVIPMVIIMVWGTEIFAFVFGKEFETAGQYARWMIPWIAFSYIVSPLSFLINVQRKLKFELWYSTLLIIFRGGVLIVGGLYFTAEVCVAGYSLVGLIFSAGLLFWLINMSKNEDLVLLCFGR